ncbi:MAG: VCBS repeat-containing protein, partial [Flavobacteriales bacterium]|nr:VCBS repeat-containing protein [Flavobacteriales bacterium]
MLKMHHCLYQILFILSSVFALNSSGQTFVDVSTIQGINAIVSGGTFSAGLSFADFNHDGWDDLTIGMNNQSPKVYLNNNGDFQEVSLQLPSNTFCKMVVWVDYNNDGNRDLFMTNRNGSNRLLRNDGDLNFTDVTSIAGVALTGGDNYGASWGDFDLDGDLNLYVCNYRFSFEPGTSADKNHLFRNDGNDIFTDITAIAGVAGNVDLSFQSAWIDYNHDLLPDLYVINDKISPNRLYRNNGNGSFTEVTGASGIGIVIDSMSASYADYNNDLLMDLYTTNTQAGNVLLRAKEDLTFQDATEETGLIVYDYTWGAVWFDMDNDTDQDIYIAESEALAFNSPNYLYRNMGIEADYTFENVSDLLTTPDISDAYTAASGDLN